MQNLIEKVKRIRIQKTSISFLGVSLELGMEQKKKVSTVHLRELYKIRYIVSRFYFLYEHRAERLVGLNDDDMNELIIGLHDDAVETYEKLADVLLGSEYFMLIDAEKRDKIIESFDYVNEIDRYLDDHDDNELSEEEIAPIIEGLIELFDNINKWIQDVQEELDGK
jgi:hypothetical protein